MMEGLYGLQYSLNDGLPPPPPQMAVEVASNYYYDDSAAFTPPPAGTAFEIAQYDPHGVHLLPVYSSSVSDSASSVAVVAAAEDDASLAILRAKITSHALYPKLLEAYIDCQKVGAPPEVARVLDEILRRSAVCKVATAGSLSSCVAGADLELDEFMETYCDVLLKYKSDLSRPFEEATLFFKKIENQLRHLCHGNRDCYTQDEFGGNSSEDEYLSGGELEIEDGGSNEDRQLMGKLMQKYSGYICALKHEFSRKKKRGKLPKEARDILLQWWNLHYKWPYPTETDKVTLAQSTGLDQKQINNWFINQRKRHWRPSENMQFSVMETLYGPF